MIEANIPDNEAARLATLRDLEVLDTAPELVFDRITRLASKLLDAPIVLVSLVDEDRQWFKSAVGLDATETPRDIAFCSHAILGSDVFVVPNATQDDRFSTNPLVTGEPHIRWYAGAPLIMGSGIHLGTLCAIDTEPRALTDDQRNILTDLAAVVVDELRLLRTVRSLQVAKDKLEEQAKALQASNEKLEQFAYIAAHDFRAPLRTIVNMTDIVASTADDPTNASLLHIRDAAMKLDTLVVAYRRLATLKTPNKEPVLLSQIVRDAEEQTGETMTVHLLDDVTVRCDQVLMTQLFTNILVNACNYGKDKRVDISVARGEHETTIYAANTVEQPVPIGPLLFAPFRRMTAKGDGLGLGLAIVDRIVRLHGGSVSAECPSHVFNIILVVPN